MGKVVHPQWHLYKQIMSSHPLFNFTAAQDNGAHCPLYYSP